MKSSVSDPRNKGTPKGQREEAGGIPWFSFLFFLLFSLSIGNSVAAVVMGRQLKSCGRERIILLDQGSSDWQNLFFPFSVLQLLGSRHNNSHRKCVAEEANYSPNMLPRALGRRFQGARRGEDHGEYMTVKKL